MSQGTEKATAAAGQKVAHQDLVNSLNVIKDIAENQLQTITDGSQDQADQLFQARNALNSTLRQASRALETIQYLNQIGCAGELAAEQVDGCGFRELLTEALRVIHEEMPFRNITILKIIPHDFPPFPVSRDQLETLLFQLLYNARRAIREGSGLITIEVQHYLYLTPENARVRHFHLRVADTGSGIAQEEFPHLFDPFYAGENTAVNHLGLYMVKKLVDLNRGTIRVESSSKGTAFFLDFAA